MVKEEKSSQVSRLEGFMTYQIMIIMFFRIAHFTFASLALQFMRIYALTQDGRSLGVSLYGKHTVRVQIPAYLIFMTSSFVFLCEQELRRELPLNYY